MERAEEKRIEVLIIDDHAMFIEGIRASLKNDENIIICGQARTGEKGLEYLKNNTCDVVLLDINMPGINGIETCERIKQLYHHIKVLALSMHNEPEHIRKMIEAGANGYAMKNIEPEELIVAIKKIHQGFPYFSTDVALSMMSPDSSLKISSMPSGGKKVLTKREIEIIRLVAQEMTSAQISKELYISEVTVEKHRQNIILKLGVRSTVGMIKYAMQNGLI